MRYVSTALWQARTSALILCSEGFGDGCSDLGIWGLVPISASASASAVGQPVHLLDGVCVPCRSRRFVGVGRERYLGNVRKASLPFLFVVYLMAWIR